MIVEGKRTTKWLSDDARLKFKANEDGSGTLTASLKDGLEFVRTLKLGTTKTAFSKLIDVVASVLDSKTKRAEVETDGVGWIVEETLDRSFDVGNNFLVSVGKRVGNGFVRAEFQASKKDLSELLYFACVCADDGTITRDETEEESDDSNDDSKEDDLAYASSDESKAESFRRTIPSDDETDSGRPILISPNELNFSSEDLARGIRLASRLDETKPFAEDEAVVLKRMTENDVELLKSALREYEFDPFPDALPKNLEDAIFENMFMPFRFICGIWEKRKDEPNAYAGYVGISDLRSEKPELEIVLLEDFRRKGIGTRAFRLLTGTAKERIGISKFVADVDPKNAPSHAFMDSIGAKPSRIVPPFDGISETLLNEIETDEADDVTESMKRVAEKFGVEPKKTLTHDFEYEIDADELARKKMES